MEGVAFTAFYSFYIVVNVRTIQYLKRSLFGNKIVVKKNKKSEIFCPSPIYICDSKTHFFFYITLGQTKIEIYYS